MKDFIYKYAITRYRIEVPTYDEKPFVVFLRIPLRVHLRVFLIIFFDNKNKRNLK